MSDYICPRCHQSGKRHYYFNQCLSCVHDRLSHAGKVNAAKHPSRPIDPLVSVKGAPKAATLPVTPLVCERTMDPAKDDYPNGLQIAIGDGKHKFAKDRRFDIMKDRVTDSFFPRRIGTREEGMRPVLRLQQLGTGEWRETPLTAIGMEVGS